MRGRISCARRALVASLVLSLAMAALSGCAHQSRGERAEREVIYAGVGPVLDWYDVNATEATLVRRGAVTLPANVQYAWPDPSRHFLYVAWSDGGPGVMGSRHGVTAFAIDGTSGALTRHGADAPLRSRPIHLSVQGTHVLVAHNEPSGVTVLALRSNGALGQEVVQPAPVDAGVFAHQVLADPSGRTVFLVTRGVGPTASTAEKPGAIKELRFANGILTNHRSIAPGGGFGFQARNLDFHPTRPWTYLVLERQNALQMFEMTRGGTLSDAPRFSASTLELPLAASASQVAGAVAMHPSGRFVYVANRASGTIDRVGSPVFAGGVNSIAVFAIDSATGEPTRIANAPTSGFSPRTIALDKRGGLLVVGNQVPLAMVDGDSVRTVPASIALFRVGADGRPLFARKYDVETNRQTTLQWVGIVGLP